MIIKIFKAGAYPQVTRGQFAKYLVGSLLAPAIPMPKPDSQYACCRRLEPGTDSFEKEGRLFV